MKDKEKADLIKSLISEVAQGRQAELLEEMVETVLRFGRDGAGIADLKLYNRAMRELRYATSVFSKYHGIRKVAVFGSARTSRDAQEYQLAREFARRIVQHGYMIITAAAMASWEPPRKGRGPRRASA